MKKKKPAPPVHNWDKLPVVLTVKDLSLIFDVSDATIKNRASAGEIHGFKIGRQWRFDREYVKGLCKTESEVIQNGE